MRRLVPLWSDCKWEGQSNSGHFLAFTLELYEYIIPFSKYDIELQLFIQTASYQLAIKYSEKYTLAVGGGRVSVIMIHN